MPLKIVHPNRYEIIGRGLVLLLSSTNQTKTPDLHMGALTEEIALLSKGHAIIGQEKRFTDASDIESARLEFTTGVRELIADQGIRIILEIRGKKEPGLGIMVAPSTSEADEIVEIVKTAFSLTVPTAVTPLSSAELPTYSSDKDVQTIVLDLGPDERSIQRETVIDIAAETVGLVNRKLGFSGRDDGPGDALD
ncbi:MAG TPA: hypothetical protein VFV92_08595 [Candidatus Bathyarchaeia archaeon]|nr:hypothetical protein [Candidatus Bathyarchaeia archaeon]